MLQSGMDAHPGAYAPGRCTVSRSPGSAPLALRGGVTHSSMVGGDGTERNRSKPGAFRPKTLIRTNAVIAHRARRTPPKTPNARPVVLSNEGLLHLPQLRETMPVPVIDTAKT